MEKEFLLLANSRKNPGRCVAGVDLATGRFMRLVANDEGDALDWKVFQDEVPGAVFSVSVLRKAPTIGAQTENWVIDPLTPVRLLRHETGDWAKKYSKGGYGPFGDPFVFYYADRYKEKTESLCVITAYALDLYGSDPQSGKGRNKIDFDIYYPGRNKTKKRIKGMSVTDPRVSKSGIGEYSSDETSHVFGGKAYLVISLPSSPFPEDCYYKFVAAIIPVE